MKDGLGSRSLVVSLKAKEQVLGAQIIVGQLTKLHLPEPKNKLDHPSVRTICRHLFCI